MYFLSVGTMRRHNWERRLAVSGFGLLPDKQRRQAECQLLCLPAFPEPIFSGIAAFLPLPMVSVRYRHTRSTLRHNRFCGCRWDTCPFSVSAAKTVRFVRDFTVTRERYAVTLRHLCRHPRFYRHPSQTKVNRRFLNFGCRHGQQFLPTAGFRFYCHPTGRKLVPVFVSRDFCAY